MTSPVWNIRNPWLEALKELGVTGISMGGQSFDNVLLKLNGRIHLKEDVLRAYRLIRDVGFDWVNLDLMAGMVGEKPVKWRDSIRHVIDLAPESVTIYQNEIPYNTQTHREFETAALPATPPTWDTKRARLLFGFDELEDLGMLACSNEGVRLTRAGLLRIDRLLPLFYNPSHRGLLYA